MKKQKKIDINLLKQQQFSKYSSLDIPKNILKENFEKVKNIQDESEIIFKFGKLMGEYMVNQIKDDNIELQIKIIDNYSYIKKLIIKNPKYNLLQDDINNIYEDAVELLRLKYDKNELLSTNIVNNMKYIILGKDKNLKIEKLEYDMSFLKKYIDLYEIDKGAYALVLGISVEEFDLILDGIQKVSNEDMYLICNLFETTSYDELKRIVNDKINFHIYKEQLLRMKEEKTKEIIPEEKEEIKEIIPEEKEEIKEIIKDEKGYTRYNLYFLKEYAKLYNLNAKYMSEKLHCGPKLVDDILTGTYYVKDTIIDDIAYEFGAKDYEALKEKILKQIETKKYNLNNNPKKLDLLNK